MDNTLTNKVEITVEKEEEPDRMPPEVLVGIFLEQALSALRQNLPIPEDVSHMASLEPVTAGIRSWTKRPPDEHPLPHAYMGDLLRFKREDVDRWAVEEAERRKADARRRKIHAAS